MIAASSVLFAFLRPPEGDGMLGHMDGLSPGGGADGMGAGLEEGEEEADGGKEAVLRLLLANADRLAAILDSSAEAGAGERTAGAFSRRLGIRRLSIVRLCSECVCAAVNLWLTSAPESSDRSELEAGLLGFLRSPVVPSILGLFAVHPFHSILHHHTCRMLYAVLDSHDPALICALVKDCGLAQWAAGAAINVHPLSNAAPLEGKSEAKPALRAGYCGHLTRLGNRLYTLGVVFEEVRTTTEKACPEWGAWVQSYVQAQNNRENIYQWACGRPAAEDDLNMDDDDDEDDGRETSIRLATLRPLGVFVVVVVCHGSSSTARARGKEACRDQAKVRTDLNTTADPRERDAIVTTIGRPSSSTTHLREILDPRARG